MYEQMEIVQGGLVFSLLGLVFALFSLFMYLHGYHQYFAKWIAISIATIGFVKLISAIVGLIRSRKHHSPLITLLKAFSLADGMVAIILTQYALLAMQKSANVNQSAGLFGFFVGVLLICMGLWFVLTSKRNRD